MPHKVNQEHIRLQRGDSRLPGGDSSWEAKRARRVGGRYRGPKRILEQLYRRQRLGDTDERRSPVVLRCLWNDEGILLVEREAEDEGPRAWLVLYQFEKSEKSSLLLQKLKGADRRRLRCRIHVPIRDDALQGEAEEQGEGWDEETDPAVGDAVEGVNKEELGVVVGLNRATDDQKGFFNCRSG